MSAAPPIELVLLWHQHQPDYRDPRSGSARLPWVRLHGTKDYLDMALRLERYPRVKATFNFVPSLLDQIEAAVAGGPDDLFDLLARPPQALSREERRRVAERCSHLPPHARVHGVETERLRESARAGEDLEPEALIEIEAGFLLGWIDPMFLDEPEAAAARRAAPRWTLADRDGLLALHRRLLGRVIPAHRELQERGRIELSASPYYHPILPLLFDVRTLHRARPDLPLPREPFTAPDDARRQLERALDHHARAFGQRPAGAWPSEGAVSPEVAELAASLGLSWLATDEGVLMRSLGPDASPKAVSTPWRFETAAGPVALFFRDRELSDRIGFAYHHWEPQAAAQDFLARLRRIGREHAGDSPAVVSVMLDGENCWEAYREDGGPFLDHLYQALEEATDVRATTPSEVLAAGRELPRLERLHSGSWIGADFRIWAGQVEKNRGWDLLSRAKRMLDAHPSATPEAREALMRAEGSDWFWWFGDDHYTPEKPVFDALFRGHLRAIYESCGEPVPLALEVPVSAPASGPGKIRPPVAFIAPVLDGRQTHYYEWQAAGHRSVAEGGGAMHAAATWMKDLYFGFDRDRFFLRVDFGAPPGEGRGLRLEFLEPAPVRLEVPALARGARPVERVAEGGRAVLGSCHVAEVLELAAPMEALGIAPGDSVRLLVQVLESGQPIETAPAGDALRFMAPDEAFDSSAWNP